MRILIKGGVWKNTEDEILKAAVMKYGKNGWARVASLLNRKSAKQCKARWYEWLDPSIKKTEWNRDEEEKLLHLAKLMPNQWRTIAPIVGRTATQCMEHYERLLDQAQEQIGEAAEDARRLRPGEIDPAPETKPARPDPIDMDEDEKEMLSEARARLANTQGKKAKRKARERTMAESRRLSMLQKRRELKAAGIESKLGGAHKKRKYIDYAREIPFQAVPPAGFYDVREENLIGKKDTLDPTVHGLELSKMEGRHQREEEEKARQKDQRALKKLFKENAPLAISQISAENDPVSLRRRLPLSLPVPQVSDGELEEIVKLGQQNALLMAPPVGLPSTFNNQSSQALIGDYSNHVSKAMPTPLRTPLQEDIIMQEAKNLRALREMTPLFGSEQEFPELYEGTGYAGIEPRKAHLPTPNTFLAESSTPLRSNSSTAGNDHNHQKLLHNASSIGGSRAGSSIAPIIRDQFGLNSSSNHSMMDDNYSESGMTSIASVRQDKHKEKLIRNQISSQLKSLPEPEFTYEVAPPQVVDDDDNLNNEDSIIFKGTAAKIEDAAEVRAKQLDLIRQKELHELSKRSSVLKRSLPRPTNIPHILAESSLDSSKYPPELVEASRIINEEMVNLLKHDEFKYPITKNIKKNQASTVSHPVIQLDDISESYLLEAKSLLNEEMIEINKEMDSPEHLDQFNQLWLDMHKDLVFIPNPTNLTSNNNNNTTIVGEYRIPKNKQETLHSVMNEFTGLKTYYDHLAKRSNKIESKLQITTLGYVNRNNSLQSTMIQAYDNYNKLCMEEICYTSLYEQEKRVVQTRLKQLKKELNEVEEIEKNIQAKYARMISLVKENDHMITL